MSTPLIIRAAEPKDAECISQLICSVADCCTISPAGDGAELFFSSISIEAIGSYIAKPNFLYLLGLLDGKLAGVVAVRDARHLLHLFVASACQYHGIGTALALRAIELSQAVSPSETFTVNSSVPAVPFYKRLGFQPQGPCVEDKGVAFVPMQLATADLDYALPQPWLRTGSSPKHLLDMRSTPLSCKLSATNNAICLLLRNYD